MPESLEHSSAASAKSEPRATRPPQLHGNGTFFVLAREDGGGFSRFGNLEMAAGIFVAARDAESGDVWSVPVGSRTERGIETELAIGVVPGEPAEIRRIVLTNRSDRQRIVEVTAYAEPTLQNPLVFASHPTFSKLFVQTESASNGRTLLAHRRPRGRDESTPWVSFTLAGGTAIESETDRARFFRRGQSQGAPNAVAGGRPLSGTTGNVLDPILALKCRVDLAPGQNEPLTLLLGVAPDRNQAVALASRCGESAFGQRALEDAAQARAAIESRHEIGADEAESWLSLAAALLEGDPRLRAEPAVRERARGVEAAHAARGLSPGRALAVALVDRPSDDAAARTLERAGRFWRELGLPIDVVVLGADAPVADRDALCAGARLVVRGTLPRPGDLAPLELPGSIDTFAKTPPLEERPASPRSNGARGGTPRLVHLASETATEPLLFFNGIGGFSARGDEYVIRLRHDSSGQLVLPPRPWINVIANERFGFLVSETGAATTWSENSREHRLTPWSNDPLLDPHEECLYVRDEESGAFWSPLPGPAPGPGTYETRHGFGASVFHHISHGIETRTEMFVLRDSPAKVTTIALRNRSDRPRVLSLVSLSTLVLGTSRQESAPFLVTEPGPVPGTMLARDVREGDFAGRVAFAGFAAANGVRDVSITGDRAGFFGPDGNRARPRALVRGEKLDGRTGWDLDPCFAQRITLEVAPQESIELSFVLGDGASRAEAEELLHMLVQPDAIQRARQDVRGFWSERLSALRIETPSPALDLLVNGWLPYQTIACRLWARSALYQSGGAFGFRDQLQDASSLAMTWPEATRAQLLLHAAHQFPEGDVLHWWHPPRSRGIRTRFADDLLWLPFLTMQYVDTTGDTDVLEESAPFLAARPLAAHEDEVFLLPSASPDSADLYEHCCRAIDRSLGTGAHGLPLFGSGDWNDGMNRVGIEGRGESTWMGFFLVGILERFAPLCAERGETERERKYAAHAKRLRGALNEAGWDGQWYRRGYFDDGTPLGSSTSDECKIDALAQAWAVLSGVASAERGTMAMNSVERHLISEEDRLIRLLTPPFVSTPHDPGYIKGYVAGVRENGGQYTHAALWVIAAMAEQGRNDRVAALLDLLNPIHHAADPQGVEKYQVEPYVIAADVYGAAPHVGRGGWTWYTGSAGWMSRVAIESLLGVRIEGGATLRMKPCIPDDWPGFTVELRLPGDGTRLTIRATNTHGSARKVTCATLDGRPAPVTQGEARIPLPRDGGAHEVRITLGPLVGRDPAAPSPSPAI